MNQKLAVVGVTAKSAFDLSVERDVFKGMNVELRAVDIGSSVDLIESFRNVDAVIDRLLAAPYTADVLDSLRQCRVIARCGIGVDAINIERAMERGIHVTNVPTYCQHEVSEHAIMLILALQRDLADYNAALKDGEWQRDVTSPSVHRLHGQVLGLIGFGSIARILAKKAYALGMNVVAADPYVDAPEMQEFKVEKASFEEVLTLSDIVSLHSPLTDETGGMVNTEALERMKSSAYLINVARGGLVVEDDLVTALQASEIAGAGLDVYEHEPSAQDDKTPAFENRLSELDNVLLTPHVAWFSKEANDERRYTAARDVRRVLEGECPENPVTDSQ